MYVEGKILIDLLGHDKYARPGQQNVHLQQARQAQYGRSAVLKPWVQGLNNFSYNDETDNDDFENSAEHKEYEGPQRVQA